MGGVFNFTDPLFGWQIYIWGWIAVIVLTVVIWLGFRYGSWEKYKAVWGLFDAYKAESQFAFIFNAGLFCEMLGERQAKCIFNYGNWSYQGVGRLKSFLFNYATVFLPDLPLAKAILYKYGKRNLDVEIAKKMQNYEWEKYSSVSSGGIHGDIILDSDNWTIPESPQHKIIENQCELYNDTSKTDQIHAYSKYQRYLIERKLPCPDGVKAFVTIPWTRIDAAFPINVGNNETSGATRQYARELEESEGNPLVKYYLPILFGGMGFAALILILRFALKFFH